MEKILILFAHPALQRSLVNKHLIKAFDSENITLHDLYEKYPQLDIDVEFEQNLLINHDIIVFMFPFYWYSTPAILKEWQDIVLEHDWAYGRKGNQLKGKLFFSLLTTGGKMDAYKKDGYNGYTIREFLRPLEQMAKLCKMDFLPPYAVTGTHSINSKIIDNHITNIKRLFENLQSENISISNANEFEMLNDFIDTLKG